MCNYCGCGYNDQDEHASEVLSGQLFGVPGTWQPDSWTKSPEQLQNEARAMNMAAYNSAANGGKKSQPALPPNRTRPL